MNLKHPRFAIWRRSAFLVLPLFVLTLGGIGLFAPSRAEASTSASISVGCSASSTNGVLAAKLKFTVRANSTADIDSLTFTVVDILAPGPGDDVVLNKVDTDIVGGVFSQVVPPISVPAVANTTTDYLATLVVNAEDASSATRTAKATVTINAAGTSVSCKVVSPAP